MTPPNPAHYLLSDVSLVLLSLPVDCHSDDHDRPIGPWYVQHNPLVSLHLLPLLLPLTIQSANGP